MTELEEIKARAEAVKRHFDRWSDIFKVMECSINSIDAKEKADLIRLILDEDQPTWRKELFD